MKPTSNIYDHLSQELSELEQKGFVRELLSSKREKGLIKTRGKLFVDFTSWDFLGLSENRTLRYALQHEVELQGFGIASPRIASGNVFEHVVAEERLAKFLGQANSLLFPTRNQALLSLITSIFSEGDVLFAEEGGQSAVEDAAYLVNAEVHSYSPEDLDSLAKQFSRLRPFVRKGLFVNPVSPVRGKIVSLSLLSDICEKYGVSLFVDETYSLGALGMRGAGGVEVAGIPHRVAGIVGSLAHCLAGYGGFVAGPSVLTRYLLNRSRALKTEISLPAPVAKWIERALDVIETLAVRRVEVLQFASAVSQAVISDGGIVSCDNDSPLVVCHFRTLAEAKIFYQGLLEKGFLVFEPIVSGVDRTVAVSLVVGVWHKEQQIRELCHAISDVLSILKGVKKDR
jgi:glycine C-acetyltransferase